MKICVVSGGFDPIHSGHIAYLKSAAALGDKLIICLNSDNWLIAKKGKFFLPFVERKIIIENLTFVTDVVDFEDDVVGSALNGLRKIQMMFPDDEIIFCNGGDRNSKNIPEMELENITFQFGVGGDDKKNSSSWILKDWAYSSEERVWGKFYNLFEDSYVKVKELIVAPGQGMSFQKHYKRNEIWFISSGKCLVNHSADDPKSPNEFILDQDATFFVNQEDWHQITNPFNEECKIIEIQYGAETSEDDIERLHYYKSE
jgi:cytidyltransferase-like protein